jgi:MFS family permease
MAGGRKRNGSLAGQLRQVCESDWVSTMTRENAERIRQEVRSPRSAAVAGIVFSVLMFAVMIVTRELTLERASQVTGNLLDLWTGAARFAIVMVPFIGIALLWFTGVIREHLGEQEDRFFSTIFFGSSVILIVMLFIWGATMGASFSIINSAAGRTIDNDIFVFGFTFMNQIIGNYALRIAGVYMLSIGTIWTKSRAMPRWLSILTFIVAGGFLFFANSVREARFIFPGWVFIVSAYILILNYRSKRGVEQEGSTA